MMNFIRRIIRNEKYLFEVICLMLFIIFFINILNSNFKEDNIEIKNEENIILSANEVSFAGKVVNEFINYCIEEKYNEAYNLLTDECKKNEFTSITEFEDKYCKQYLSSVKNYSIGIEQYEESAIIYKIRFLYNAIETGIEVKNCKVKSIIDSNDVDNPKIYIENDKK